MRLSHLVVLATTARESRDISVRIAASSPGLYFQSPMDPRHPAAIEAHGHL
jgi:hypothetical protein